MPGTRDGGDGDDDASRDSPRQVSYLRPSNQERQQLQAEYVATSGHSLSFREIDLALFRPLGDRQEMQEACQSSLNMLLNFPNRGLIGVELAASVSL